MNGLLIFCSFVTLCSATNNPPSYCLPIQPITQDLQDLQIQPQPKVITQQGRPGRVGPIGPAGPIDQKGAPGTTGSCACEPSEIEQLRLEMQIMRG